MLLADSNVLIYATQPEHQGLRKWLLDAKPKISIISRVEVLGYHKLGADEKAALGDMLDCMELWSTSRRPVTKSPSACVSSADWPLATR